MWISCKVGVELALFQKKNVPPPGIRPLKRLSAWFEVTLTGLCAKIEIPDLQLYLWYLILWSKVWKMPLFFWRRKWLFLWISQLLLLRKKCPFRRDTTNGNKQFKGTKTLIWYLIKYLIRQSLKGTVVNRTLSSLHGVTLNSAYSPFIPD